MVGQHVDQRDDVLGRPRLPALVDDVVDTADYYLLIAQVLV